MFRSAYRVQMELTALADNKANMMTSINGIIISIIIAAVAPKLDTNPWLLVPSTVILTGTLFSIIFSILAARPRINTAPITLEDLKRSEGNILFFGNFANLDKYHFTQGMLELVSDRDVLYETMIHNLHDLGLVLKKKFALLKVAYNAFMVALVAACSSGSCNRPAETPRPSSGTHGTAFLSQVKAALRAWPIVKGSTFDSEVCHVFHSLQDSVQTVQPHQPS